MLMEYAAWKLFIDAAELGSLSKVAAAYGTSQPHISRHQRSSNRIAADDCFSAPAAASC